MPARPKVHGRFQFTIRTALIVTAVVAFVIGGGKWILSEAARNAMADKRQTTVSCFRMVGHSLQIYSHEYGHLPWPVRRERTGQATNLGDPNGAGKPLYSWRAEVAELADSWWQGGPWDRSKPWDDPANQLIAAFPWRYCYDAAGLDERFCIPTRFSPETNMLAITGPGTAFGTGEEPPASMSKVDGDTILVVEVEHSGLHWMRPGDFDIRDMPRTLNAPDGSGISSRYEGGFHVLFADGDVWFLSNQVPFEELERFFTIEGARNADRQEVLGPYQIDGVKGNKWEY